MKARGGKRAGAGRKPNPTPRTNITIKIDLADAAKFRRICHAKKVTQAAWLSRKIKDEK